MQNIPIVYEDENVLAVDKPAGLIVHQAVMGYASQVPSIVEWLLKERSEVQGVGDEPILRPGIVHRLDKDTSGVLIIAKNQKAFEFLKSQFQNKEVKKKYIALVEGKLKNPRGIIDLPIGKSKSDFRKKVAGGRIVGKTREAITEYKIEKEFGSRKGEMGGYTLLEVYPKTGRTHQIRVHLKAIGHPIVCDKLYGSKNSVCPFGLNRHFLHASSIDFVLPSSLNTREINGERIQLEVDLPRELQNVLNMLK